MERGGRRTYRHVRSVRESEIAERVQAREEKRAEKERKRKEKSGKQKEMSRRRCIWCGLDEERSRCEHRSTAAAAVDERYKMTQLCALCGRAVAAPDVERVLLRCVLGCTGGWSCSPASPVLTQQHVQHVPHRSMPSSAPYGWVQCVPQHTDVMQQLHSSWSKISLACGLMCTFVVPLRHRSQFQNSCTYIARHN
jgi:hypothetical protein